MGLAAEVQSRYPATRLAQLTNPGEQENAGTVDATVLGLACTDVEADFLTYCATEFDATEARHIPVAVEGVIAYLYQRGETPGSAADKKFEKYLERLKSLAKVTGRDRVGIKSSSILTPSPEQDGSETVRPDTDRPGFTDLIPNAARPQRKDPNSILDIGP